MHTRIARPPRPQCVVEWKIVTHVDSRNAAERARKIVIHTEYKRVRPLGKSSFTRHVWNPISAGAHGRGRMGGVGLISRSATRLV